MDAIAQMKETAKKGWSTFAPFEQHTCTAAPKLVRFAGIAPGCAVLDVATGTGVVALTAARHGARVTGLDLSPALVARAQENAALVGLDATFLEGDAEALPFPDASFDVVLSQFGHMFAPRPDVVTKELLRVLRPGGTIAFSTWPMEMYVGRFFQLLGKYSPPPPPGSTPPVTWGEPRIVTERLGDAVTGLRFGRDAMHAPTLGAQHWRAFAEQHIGPFAGLVAALGAQDPARLTQLRAEHDLLFAEFFADNVLRQDFLMSRATKK